jgi:heme-degrading monooxygenase HmoA
MFIRGNVQDYKTWKSVFDSKNDLRRRYGQQSHQILRPENGSNEVDILFVWDDLDNARRFASSAELKETMQEAGVVGKPEILFLEEAARG